MLMNFLFLFLLSLTIVYSLPCPSKCLCKPIDMNEIDFTRMSYLIDCSNQFFNNDKLIYRAEQWTINEDKIFLDNDDGDSSKDYIISIDLSNNLSLKQFTSNTIKLTDFSFEIRSLLLTNQPTNFILHPNAFTSLLYQSLKILNLSSCCQKIPKQCSQIFQPLKKLQILDLSGSHMYKTCLNTPGTISSTLTELHLRNNIYDINTFSNTSHLFDGVRKLSDKLDFQNSRFRLNTSREGNCLFETFEQIKSLDLSSIQFESNSNDIEINLGYLLKCEIQSDDNHPGKQLLRLFLRQLGLQRLPEWFTNNRFPFLRLLDLSTNHFYSIDISIFQNLRYLSLAYNPIELNQTGWRKDTIYDSINLRSTTINQTFNLTRRLKKLFKLTSNIDYSGNEGNISPNLTVIENDFPSNEIILNLSRTNIESFQIKSIDLRRLDISFNSLIELNLTEQMKLNYLDCSNQYYLEKLILNKQLSELIEFKCSKNSLKTIEHFSFSQNEQIKLIDLSNNLIQSLEDLFSNLTSRYLYSINLKSNSISIISSNIFHQKLFNLYQIDLSWNQIHTIQSNAFQAPNLQILDLTGNSLINIEPKAILTVSLRLFYISNNTQQLNDRCQQSNSSNDNLLFLYINWFKQNGTLMNNKQIKFDKCLRYLNQTKRNEIFKTSKQVIRYYSLYFIIGISLIGILFGGLHFYRKNKLTLFPRFQRYKQLDKNNLVENGTEMDQHSYEDDEIVMNLKEPPFNKFT